jgi:hypothetical protein
MTMTKYDVRVRRSIECTVQVEAENELEAIKQVDRRDFTLPPRDEWDGIKGWEYEVYEQ